jgi:Glycogen recognition site of AMP-activated protein kinase
VKWRSAGVGFVAWFASSLLSTAVAAQDIALDLSAGQIVYEPLSADVATNNAAATLRYDLPQGLWLYGTAAMPFGSSDSRWDGFGIGSRFLHRTSSTHVNIGADVDGHGYLFRDGVLDQSGSGGFIEAIPFIHVPAGAATFEVRGGWRGETLSYAGAVDTRHVFETGAHATYGSLVIVEGDARWVHASEGVYPFFGGRLRYGGAPVQVWLQAGRWFSSSLHDAAWGAGVDLAMTDRLTLWSSVRQDAPDPLYWNVPRRNWSVGMTHRFNSRARRQSVTAPRVDGGGVLIRLDAGEVSGTSVSVAGDFNGWRPVPLQHEGREWLIRLPLAPGVYHYAFRSDRGQWFVPPSVPNRRDDGMGGYVAVLVVS